MSRSDHEQLMRLLYQKDRELREDFLPRVERDYASAAAVPIESVIGKGREFVNEAQIRQYVLDPILSCLGWRLDNIDNALVEAPVEDNLNRGTRRRFLDYFGREVKDEQIRSLLVIEAKRLRIDLPGDRDQPLLPQFIEAIRSFRNPSGSNPVSSIWQEILGDVADYVQRLKHTSSAGEPSTLLLTNGNWFVVILKPYEVLVRSIVTEQEVIIFESLRDGAGRADSLYELISFKSLSKAIPPQHFAELQTFVGDNLTVPLPVSLALEVYKNPWPDAKPLLGMIPFANVRIPDGGWVSFHLDGGLAEKVIIDKSPDKLEENMQEIGVRAKYLIDRLGEQAQVELVSASNYISDRPIPRFPETRLLRVEQDNKKFVWHLGNQTRPILEPNEFDSCKYHSHAPCHEEGMAHLPVPLVAQSIEPPSYFTNASPVHCAHKKIHVLRERKCEIGLLEKFLCCRRCASNTVCWPEGFEDFPCQSSNQTN